MGSGIIFYEYEKCEKFKDFDVRAYAELGTFKARCYHLDDEASVHPLRSIRIDPDLSIRDSGIGGMESSNEKKDVREEDFEEEVLASSSLLMDINAGERLPTLHREVEPSL
ncbi:hypothetical protein PIB30_039702 [Stylosanthes scabra]|uniref:Uncharacterized protein n=1 Tax=Stylosanthes scabra TaxID=79078 RepID=A0ABU6YEV1_9FABA|nr:hypothetical protein [Stylosanthes scabra]